MRNGRKLFSPFESLNSKLFSRYLLVIFVCLSLNTLIISVFTYYSSTAGIREELGKSFTGKLYQASTVVDLVINNIDRTAGQFVTDQQVNDFAGSGNAFSMNEMRMIANRIGVLNFSNRLVHSVYLYFEKAGIVTTSINGETYSVGQFYDQGWMEGYKTLGFSQTLPTRKIEREISGEKTTADVVSYMRSFPLGMVKNGAVVINLDEKMLTEYLTKNILQDSELFLVTDREGATILSSDQSLLYQRVDDIASWVKNSKEDQSWFVRDFQNKEMLIAYFRPEGSQWQYIAMVPTDKLYLIIRQTQTKMIIVCLLLLILGAALSLWISYGFYKPIQKVLEGIFSMDKSAAESREKDEVQLIQKVFKELYGEKVSMEEKYNASLPVLREKFFRLLLEQGVISQNEYADKTQALSILFHSSNFRVILFEISRRDRYRWVSTTEGISAVNKFIMETVERLLPEGYSMLAGEIDSSKTAVILNYPAPGDDSEATGILRLCNELIGIFNEKMNIRVFAGVGKCVKGFEEICISYASSAEALKYKFVDRQDRVVYINDVEAAAFDRIDMMFDKEELLIKFLRSCDLYNCNLTIQRLCEGIMAQKMPMDAVNTVAARVIGSINKLAIELGMADLVESTRNADERESDELIYSFETLDELASNLESKCRSVIERLEEKKGSKSEELIIRAKEYILKNYAKELSVDDVAGTLDISGAHFLRVFKKEMNCTFTEYLNMVRMEKAVEFLSGTELKVNEIARNVGFNNPTYFNTLFKNKYGMTPLRYRELHVWKK